MGGAIAATVLTLGPGASAFALEPMYEKAIRGQRREEKHNKVKLEEEFKNKSQKASYLKPVDPVWLWNPKVQSMEDLNSEGYNIKSGSSTEDIIEAAERSKTVGFATDDGEQVDLNSISEVDTDLDTDSDSEED